MNLPPDYLAALTAKNATVRLVLSAHVYIEDDDGETYGRAVPVNLFGSTTIDFQQLRENPDDFVSLMEEHAHGCLAKIIGDAPSVTAFIRGSEEDGVHQPGVAEIMAGALPLIAGGS